MESKAFTDTGLGKRQCWSFPSGTSLSPLASKAEEVPGRFQHAMRFFLESGESSVCSTVEWEGSLLEGSLHQERRVRFLGFTLGPVHPLSTVALGYYPNLSESESLSGSIGERNHSVRWQEVSSRQVVPSPVLFVMSLRSQKSK